jgi:hypothetical protein
MDREIVEIKRCDRCATVVHAMVDDRYLDANGEPFRAVYWLPRRVHTADDCDVSLRLYVEEWPCLF